jgi:hypothetical protein
MNGKIVIFHLPTKTYNTKLSKFCQKFYGQDTSSWGGKYRYHRHGLLDDIPHHKLLRGVIIIKNEDITRVLEFLKTYNADVHVRTVELSEEDRKLLGA